MSDEAGPTGIRVALLDDHDIVLEGLSRMLERSGFTVVLADTDPERFVDRAQSLAPALCVLDLRLGHGRSGLDVTREVLAAVPRTKVAILTSSEDGAVAAAAMRAGATGFVIKDASPEMLIDRLAAVANGDLIFDGRVAQGALAPASLTAITLTDQEVRILQLIADGLTNKQIAEEMFLSPHTIKEYVTRTMRKLDARSRAETVARAMAAGLI